MPKLPPITFKIKYFDAEVGLSFIHEVSEDCYYNAIADIIFTRYFKGCDESAKRGIKNFIESEDLDDVLEELFMEDIKDYFIDEACADENCEYI